MKCESRIRCNRIFLFMIDIILIEALMTKLKNIDVIQLISLLLIAVLAVVSTVSSADARFIQPDDWNPTNEGVGTNRYAYADNDPINKSDPNGHLFFAPFAMGCVGSGACLAITSAATVIAGFATQAGHLMSGRSSVEPDWGEVRALLANGVPRERAIEISKDNVLAQGQHPRQQQSQFRSSLVETGKLDSGQKQAAHHIVEKSDPAARDAVALLNKSGISINSTSNGVGLSEHARGGRHTTSYSSAVLSRLSPYSEEEDLRRELEQIGRELVSYDKQGKTVDDWGRDQSSGSGDSHEESEALKR
ncbi:AHH domain-containing protein [Neorhizobium galegae]|uniref:AHH domain-containing protein n=1 Tax=Neorhizobium galegae TaxID=399 RepID=UPI001F1F6A45|nr:AHH domain-containing protein [Neorhizobium galegae]UIK07659.1 AHH domain-containing protein [Neorhizobium galegae]